MKWTGRAGLWLPAQTRAPQTTLRRWGLSTLSSGPDVLILGAGVIGLSLALELHRRGSSVTLFEPRAAATQASWAAAGMLAAGDPFNPPALAPLSRLSSALYPAFLEELEYLSGEAVPFQTDTAVQSLEDGRTLTLQEHSLDPRQLAVALLMAVQKAGIPLRQRQTPPTGDTLGARTVVHASGAWASPEISPRKGQMLRVLLPPSSTLREVYRSERVYVVPRTRGPQAGTALIGATVENVGFNLEVFPEDLAALRARGAALVPHAPELADPAQTPMVEAWAGLRPATPDDLPLLGDMPAANHVATSGNGPQAGPRHLMAAGHFRNGILLAPATAAVIADMIYGRQPVLDLAPFSPGRFTRMPESAS